MTAKVRFTVNAVPREVELEPRELLLDTLRERLALTGAHGACEQGACGSCTVLVDGVGVRSCLMFAVQADGTSVETVEGVASDGELHPVQSALSEFHGLQCGFCTPGIVLAAIELLRDNPEPTREEIEEGMSGNLCRCTGYAGIVDAIWAASRAQAVEAS